ncbi:MAG: 2-C-methyl-D-erythritol 2,4-cyclodiphosphate synthase [Oscillospiraceae bacterium]|nr:2-C-methyl-D-erythritol 2,4-cyclodiphosphate synthase [Oscillospiraceae bacterium]
MFRIGNGYDAHRLTVGRDLILGGVKIPYSKGLLGHSDADVLVHAIADSLLGALNLGDLGKLFPDTEERYKDASSIKLLAYINTLIVSKGYKIVNIDSVIVAQQPKLKPHIDKMKFNIAKALNTDAERISIKATTEEEMGFTGSGDGMSAHAVCLIVKI